MENFMLQCQKEKNISSQMNSAENKVGPWYQRVLAALILEDHVDEIDDSLDIEHISASEVLSCNGNISSTNGLNIRDQDFDLLPVHQGPLHSDTESISRLSKNGSDGISAAMMCSSHSLSFDCQYENVSLDDKVLLELQSIGLYPEAVVRFQLYFI